MALKKTGMAEEDRHGSEEDRHGSEEDRHGYFILVVEEMRTKIII